MEITAKTDLMVNQKRGSLLAPGRRFDALRTPDGTDGDSLFFSIGTEDKLHVIREVQQSKTGWDMIDLSSRVSDGNAAVKAVDFTLAQDPTTRAFDLALVAEIKGEHALYVSLEHNNTAADWASNLTWNVVPFDADSKPSRLEIAKVHLMNLPDGNDGFTQNCFVDIVRDPNNANKPLERYYVNLNAETGATKWQKQNLYTDAKAGTVTSCVGNRDVDDHPGIYTLGSVGKNQTLVYAPGMDALDDTAPTPTFLTVPKGVVGTGITSILDKAGVSTLFASGTKGLYAFTPDNQDEDAQATLIVPTVTLVDEDLFGSLTNLQATTDNLRTSVWGVNYQGSLVQASCPAGSEGDSTQWTRPVRISPGVTNYAFYLNGTNDTDPAHMLFVHSRDDQLHHLSQDADTTCWNTRRLLLPATAPGVYHQSNTYTSHVVVRSTDGSSTAGVDVTVASKVATTMFVNGDYFVLQPDKPVAVKTGSNGTLSIVQEAPSLSQGNVFTVTTTDSNGKTTSLAVDPLTKAMGRLEKVQSADGLTQATYLDKDDKPQPLLPDGVDEGTKKAAAAAITNLLDAHRDMPADGSKYGAQGKSLQASLKSTSRSTAFAVSFAPNQPPKLHDEKSAHALIKSKLGHRQNTTSSLSADVNLLSSPVDWISTAIGDLGRFLGSAWDAVTELAFKAIDAGWQVLVTIGNMVYDVVLDCIAAVATLIDRVWDWLVVAWDTLKDFLDDLFPWKAIKRTKDVLKNVVNVHIDLAITQVKTLRADALQVFADTETRLHAATGVKHGQTTGTVKQATTTQSPAWVDGDPSRGQPDGSDSPKANWFLQQLEDLAEDFDIGGFGSFSTELANQIAALLDKVFAAAQQEVAVLGATVDKIRALIDKAYSMSTQQLVINVLDILGDVVLESASVVVGLLFDLVVLVIDSFKRLANATVEIPVVSSVYEFFVEEPLTVLDALCLLAAVPITVVVKLATDQDPYPRGAKTDALLKAKDYKTMAPLLGLKPKQSKLAAGLAGEAESEDLRKFKYITNLTSGFAGHVMAVIKTINYVRSLTPAATPPMRLLDAFGSLTAIVNQANTFPAFQQSSTDLGAASDVITILTVVKGCVDGVVGAGLGSGPSRKYFLDYVRVTGAMMATSRAVVLVMQIFKWDGTEKDSEVVVAMANLMRAVGGVLEIGTLSVIDPEVSAFFLVGALGFVSTAAKLQLAAGGMQVQKK
ncbi:hypothetical protein B0T24DRAFT_722445 [Lasiosphaeria ovina]|uniref:Uncharacterized protein n=1 Tax=Lasiosphaeria ovina TaxID=92902 RepID=A0AAE0K4S0_9PEZI|nr:hypothetical protein B0T24DRAFT_722445 [Lasiosphaeria ovina]